MVNTSVAGGVIEAAEREIAYCPFLIQYKLLLRIFKIKLKVYSCLSN